MLSNKIRRERLIRIIQEIQEVKDRNNEINYDLTLEEIKALNPDRVSEEEIERRKERLEQYKYLKLDFEYYVLELERVQNTKIKLTSILTGLPSSNVSKTPDKRWDEVMDYTKELVDYLTDRAKEILIELETFERAIDRLPIRERTVLTGRYIAGLQFKEILKKFPMSEKSMYLVHKHGLELIDMSELDKIEYW